MPGRRSTLAHPVLCLVLVAAPPAFAGVPFTGKVIGLTLYYSASVNGSYNSGL